jgi:hypothetical protein
MAYGPYIREGPFWLNEEVKICHQMLLKADVYFRSMGGKPTVNTGKSRNPGGIVPGTWLSTR